MIIELVFETTSVVSSFTQNLGCGFMQEEEKGGKRGRELCKKSLSEYVCGLGGVGCFLCPRGFFLRRTHHTGVSIKQSKEWPCSELVKNLGQ